MFPLIHARMTTNTAPPTRHNPRRVSPAKPRIATLFTYSLSLGSEPYGTRTRSLLIEKQVILPIDLTVLNVRSLASRPELNRLKRPDLPHLKL